MKMQKILIGSDPELFARDANTKRFLSCHDILPGVKGDPFLLSRGGVQPDGVAAEFNTEPTDTLSEFDNILDVTISELKGMFKSDIELVAEPTAWFDQKYFESLPQVALALGCEPDFNAWEGCMNEPPETDKPMRTGAGHVHVGFTEEADEWSQDHIQKCENIVKSLDLTLFFKSLEWDNDNTRRSLYGNPGSFRPKSYGVEYRPLSNKWVFDKNARAVVFNTAQSVSERVVSGDTSIIEDQVLVQALQEFNSSGKVGNLPKVLSRIEEVHHV